MKKNRRGNMLQLGDRQTHCSRSEIRNWEDRGWLRFLQHVFDNSRTNHLLGSSLGLMGWTANIMINMFVFTYVLFWQSQRTSLKLNMFSPCIWVFFFGVFGVSLVRMSITHWVIPSRAFTYHRKVRCWCERCGCWQESGGRRDMADSPHPKYFSKTWEFFETGEIWNGREERYGR